MQQTFSRAVCSSSMDVDFNMSDFTDGFACAVASPLRFNILLNGTIVGTYNFPGGTGGPFGTSWHVKGTIPYAAVSASGGAFTLRFEALDTVCAGGGSWDWIAGGSVTLH